MTGQWYNISCFLWQLKERDVKKLADNSECMYANVCVWVSECVSLFFKSTIYYV